MLNADQVQALMDQLNSELFDAQERNHERAIDQIATGEVDLSVFAEDARTVDRCRHQLAILEQVLEIEA